MSIGILKIGESILRVHCLWISLVFEVLAEFQSKSIKRTEFRGMAKGYQHIALGKIKLPPTVSLFSGKILLAVILFDFLRAIFSEVAKVI